MLFQTVITLNHVRPKLVADVVCNKVLLTHYVYSASFVPMCVSPHCGMKLHICYICISQIFILKIIYLLNKGGYAILLSFSVKLIGGHIFFTFHCC